MMNAGQEWPAFVVSREVNKKISHSPINGVHGSLIRVYASEEAAKAVVRDQIDIWRHTYENERVEVDFDKMAAWFDYDSNDGCRWFITLIETP